MAIIDIVKQAVLSLDIEQPSSLFSNTDRTSIELVETVNNAAQQILDEYDWSALIRIATVTGDGSGSFPLPDDYSRMVRDANLWTDGLTWNPSQQVSDFNQWLQIQSYQIDTWQSRWAVFGGALNIMPTLPTGQVLSFGYISNAIVNGADTTRFTADTDTFVLDDRLLKLGIIWNWKKSKGFDYQSELAEYADHMSKKRFRDRGAPQTIYSGRGYGWPTGVRFP